MLIWISWVDSTEYSRWNNREDLEEDFDKDTLLCESVGWIIKEDKDRLMIGPHYSKGTNSFSGTFSIPKVAIKEIVEIKDV